MSEEPHPAQELADLVSSLRQLTRAWRGVGATAVAWSDRDPCWPDIAPSPGPAAESPASRRTEHVAHRGPTPSPQPRARPSAVGSPARLFPSSTPRPRSLPPRPTAPDQPGRWQGYGEAADPARAMAAVRDKLGDCERCPLHRGRSTLVFGVGSPQARLVVVGEAPGFHEDQQGEPFVGPAGQMLDRMLENVLGMKRSEVYIMNVLKCRPPDNRDPEPHEVAACRPFFDSQLNVIRPQAILALGRYATQSLLDSPRGIMALRGRWSAYRGIPVMPTFHPAYLLRKPRDKRLTWQDLLALQERLAGDPS